MMRERSAVPSAPPTARTDSIIPIKKQIIIFHP
jgi:hypothetical protein